MEFGLRTPSRATSHTGTFPPKSPRTIVRDRISVQDLSVLASPPLLLVHTVPSNCAAMFLVNLEMLIDWKVQVRYLKEEYSRFPA